MDERIFDLVGYENQAMVSPVLEALDDMMRRLQEMSPDEKTITQVGKSTQVGMCGQRHSYLDSLPPLQFVIETLKKRIEAEIKTTEMPFIRLLALLLR